ncbi:hypothetical protein F5878DRAFT_644388 [Lentinula raphanica]|uniref:Uncharacterized protein n=1 Tax=Lentinula raphanica TaxID=153919 RepID=A0AA38UA53_9AGAR|nr:hypothetical protein F5878DRAFT_644388 [Lentinula raphanica]
MSSTTASTYYHTPMPAHHHFYLRMILRSANERYHLIAETFRQNLRLSHHARRRAQAKGLRVDTAQAAACPQKLVSVLPLHEIDTSVSPTLNRAASEDLILALTPPSEQRPVIPRITIPIASRPIVERDVSAPTTRTSEPREVSAPVVLRGQGNPWRGPTSRFSITPNDELFQVHNRSVVPDVPEDMTEGEEDPSSASSSSGPSTPEDDTSLLRSKRKPLEIEDEPAFAAEKRPKARALCHSCESLSTHQVKHSTFARNGLVVKPARECCGRALLLRDPISLVYTPESFQSLAAIQG